jgi:hypothetical protein
MAHSGSGIRGVGKRPLQHFLLPCRLGSVRLLSVTRGLVGTILGASGGAMQMHGVRYLGEQGGAYLRYVTSALLPASCGVRAVSFPPGVGDSAYVGKRGRHPDCVVFRR